jgi:hypothetical protein
MTVPFQLEGQEFLALNGGLQFKFTEAISFIVNCKTQKEIDEFWKKLSEGGEKGPCGWLKDKYPGRSCRLFGRNDGDKDLANRKGDECTTPNAEARHKEIERRMSNDDSGLKDDRFRSYRESNARAEQVWQRWIGTRKFEDH